MENKSLRKDWTLEQIEFRDIQAEIIEIAEKRKILPFDFVLILGDLIKNFKEELASQGLGEQNG